MHLWDYLGGGGGDATVNKHGAKRSGMKQLKIAKRKVELKEKTRKCEAEGRICAWGNFTPRKTRRMHRETASEMDS